MDLSEAISEIAKRISSLPSLQYVEIEGRLGFYQKSSASSKKYFDSNITETFYTRIKEGLETKKDWKTTNSSTETDYFHKGKRLTVREDGSQQCICKKKLCHMDFQIQNSPLDIRITISVETPQKVDNFPVQENCEHMRIKSRKTFVYRNWAFQLTKITTIRNTVEFISYEMEVELLNADDILRKQGTQYISHSLILKLIDMVNMCEAVGQTSYLKYKGATDFKKS